MIPALQFVARRSEERGHADHGWLKAFHTFSFAGYYDRNHQQHGPLRVINEDRIAPRKGFGTHPHREFEIFTYIVSGELEHKDSMGNTEILKRGDLQMTSTGTGISHSEKTYGGKELHILQIWSMPSQNGLTPKYFTRHFSDEEKKDKWARVVAPAWEEDVKASVRDGTSGPAPVNSALTLYATILSPGQSLSRLLSGKKAYVHVVQTSGYNGGEAKGASVRFSGNAGSELELREGDGAYIKVNTQGAVMEVANTGDRKAEVLVFDLD
ncbi:pirin domain-containing protein [Coprinopsis marcescibilis]|uniref:Pirin domain-containing protein n=1 Tax=Coprinopsis marcescibilis TaxID=230819 RepID=A0A5C3KXK1_COPMA|nr:pirin domain-containing protein [Coprinopsis marcescibilis]